MFLKLIKSKFIFGITVSVILIVLTFGAVTINAEDNATIAIDEYGVGTVNGKINFPIAGENDMLLYGEYEKSVTLTIISPETERSSINNDKMKDTSLNVMKIIRFVDQTTVDSEGNYSFSFKLRGITGDYTFIISNPLINEEYYKVYYENKLYIDFNEIKRNKSYDEMVNFLDNNKALLEFDNIGFSLLNDEERKYIVNLIFEMNDMNSQSELNAALDGLEIKKLLFKITKDTNILVNYIIRCYENNDVYFNGRFIEIFCSSCNSETQNKIMSAYTESECDFSSEFKTSFEYRILSEYIKSFSYYGQIISLIESDNNILGLNQSDLAIYKKIYDKNTVCKNMFDAIDDVSSLDEYRILFGTYVSAQKNKETEKKKSGSSSAKSGGGSYSLSSITPQPTAAPQTETVKEIVFSDIADVGWAAESIENLARKSIINGVTADAFCPNENIKREEFIKILTTGLRLTGTEAAVQFYDVNQTDYYYNAIGAAVRARIIMGDENGNFGMGKEITRQDMAVILNRTAKMLEFSLNGNTDASFTDEAQIEEYAKKSVQALASSGIIKGMDNGEYMPQKSLTRAEAATVLYKFFLAVGVLK